MEFTHKNYGKLLIGAKSQIIISAKNRKLTGNEF